MPNRSDAAQFARGFLMGAADVIPGISGGTVALVLGIYARLVGAISRFDLAALKEVRHRRFAAAATRVDLRFLLALGAGIACAILALSSVIKHLLTQHREPTYAVFFGLILGSSLLVARLVPRWSLLRIAAAVAGAVAAFVFVGMRQLQNPPDMHPVYLFFCGFVAICAMVLPGVSGSFLLLILGAYTQVLDLLHRLKGFAFSTNDLVCLATFLCGIALGLLSFSKLLRWLLGRYEAMTLAVLTGLMLGSLRRLWPFQTDTTPGVEKFDRKIFEAVWPDVTTPAVWGTLLLIVVACVFVIALDRLALRRAGT